MSPCLEIMSKNPATTENNTISLSLSENLQLCQNSEIIIQDEIIYDWEIVLKVPRFCSHTSK